MKNLMVKSAGLFLMGLATWIVYSLPSPLGMMAGMISLMTGYLMLLYGYSAETVNRLDWIARSIGTIGVFLGVTMIASEQNFNSLSIGGISFLTGLILLTGGIRQVSFFKNGMKFLREYFRFY